MAVLFSCPVVSFATTWATACQASLSLTTSRGLPKFMSIASVMSNVWIVYTIIVINCCKNGITTHLFLIHLNTQLLTPCNQLKKSRKV